MGEERVRIDIELARTQDIGGVPFVGAFAIEASDEGPPQLVPGSPLESLGLPHGLDPVYAATEGFAGKVGQTLRLSGSPRRVVIAGLGSSWRQDADAWRRAAAALVQAAGGLGEAAVVVPAEAPGAALAEGLSLATYTFDAYRSNPATTRLERVFVVCPEGRPVALSDSIARGSCVADAVCFARDLVNTPPSDLDPECFAERVVEHLARRPDIVLEVWDRARIESERLGALLGVSRGSSKPPRVVIAHRAPSSPRDSGTDHVVLVGKGITFDSGGLSLKTPEGMTTMKTDMSGAATVMAALCASSDLGIDIEVTAIAMVSENMPGPSALKPGDVLRTRSGTTIEVLNTDAEGRLVLSDGLTLARERNPSAIVDVATLTGAQIVALGRSMGALYSSDDTLAAQVTAAASLAGEPLWRMPLFHPYLEHLESDVADLKNIGLPLQAGSVVAALVLSKFVGDTPWAHLDIAGPARSAERSGYLSKGGTGFGVRTIVELLDARSLRPQL
ncbi:MAG: leucyl aminopeptidase [Acidimicrobiales bacterium]